MVPSLVFAEHAFTFGDKRLGHGENIRDATMTTRLWTPDKARVGQTTLELFSSWMLSRIGKPLQGYDELHRDSVTSSPEFWFVQWDFTKVSGDKGSEPLLPDAGKVPGAQVFPNGTSNFTGSLLHRAIAALTDNGRGGSSPDRQAPAMLPT
jgi:hypothetical protein